MAKDRLGGNHLTDGCGPWTSRFTALFTALSAIGEKLAISRLNLLNRAAAVGVLAKGLPVSISCTALCGWLGR